MTNINDLLIDDEEATEDDQSPAERFSRQIDAYYALPRKEYVRDRIRFSPSGVSKCERELYFTFTNAPTDQVDLTPWKQRLARNGTAVHEFMQRDLRKMPDALFDAGREDAIAYVPILFDRDDGRQQFEHVGERSYEVTLDGETYIVTLAGRCDGMLREVGTNDIVGLEIKTKDKAKGVTKIRRMGVEPYHREQDVAYSLIFGIDRWLVYYESLQKPEWRDDDKDDHTTVHIVVDEDEKRAILVKLARVVRAIQREEAPPGDFSKCRFCAYKGECGRVEKEAK